MIRIVTLDDFIDVFAKAKERGPEFILSKLNLKKIDRTKSSFNDELGVMTSNWWIIPSVRERWNDKISGDPKVDYKEHYINNYVTEGDSLKLLSLGSGGCGNELKFASFPQFKEIVCVDISEYRLREAAVQASEKGLQNIHFICKDVYQYDYPDNYFDIVLFNSSLHHFENVRHFLRTEVQKTLKPGGRVIINEYVGPNRLQYPSSQIRSINQALSLIEKKDRKMHKTSITKRHYSGPGLIRMLISDPSEGIDSASIIPALHETFNVLEEKPYGGNILMPVLRSISHHFIDEDERKTQTLRKLFAFEDDYLKSHKSDFVFGVYEKKQ